nr:uncharacterized protein LOC117853877 [Setaria viridis]
MTRVVDSRPPVPEDAERWQQNRLLAEKHKMRKDKETARKKKKKKAAKELQRQRWGTDFILLLAPNKELRVSSTSAGRAATLPAASGGVAGETAGPIAEAASAAATGGRVSQSGTGQGPTPAPPSASVVDPAGQGVVPGVPPAGEVIDLDDEVEEEHAGEASAMEGAPTVTAEMAAAEMGAVAPVVATETVAAAVKGKFTPAAATGTAAAMEAGTPAPVAAMEMGAAVEGGPTLHWRSREDPQRPLFMLDDAEEWGNWQAVQGGLANVRAALSSAIGELDGVVVPDG